MSTPAPLVTGLDPAQLLVRTWPPSELWRIYQAMYGSIGFNSSTGYNARFSPLERPDGSVIPTLYAGSNLDVALMETVFHDVPVPSAGFNVRVSRSKESRRAASVSAGGLKLIDFTGIGLRRLGLARADVIDSMKSRYADTRALAEWAYQHAPAANGIVWTSRQDDSGQAFLLFEDRVPTGALSVLQHDLPIVSGPVRSAMLQLAHRLGGFVLFDP